MPSLPTVPTAPVTLTAITSTYGQQVQAWIAFLANPPNFVGNDTTGTNVTTGGTGVALAYDAEEIDNVNGHDLVTNPTRYTAQYPGRYLCVATAVFPSNATGRRQISLQKNGTTNYTDANGTVGAVTGIIRVQAVREILFAVNDYVEGIAFQDSGGTLNTVTGTLQVLWVGSS